MYALLWWHLRRNLWRLLPWCVMSTWIHHLPLGVGHVEGGEQLLWWVACRHGVGRWVLKHCHQALSRTQNSQWLSSFTSISLPIINWMMFPSSFLTLFDLISWWVENYYKFYDNNYREKLIRCINYNFECTLYYNSKIAHVPS